MGYLVSAAGFSAPPVIHHLEGRSPWLLRHCWYGSRPSPAKKAQSRNFLSRRSRLPRRNPTRNHGSRLGSDRRRSASSTPSQTTRHARLILAAPWEKPSRRKPTSSSPRHRTSVISTLSP